MKNKKRFDCLVWFLVVICRWLPVSIDIEWIEYDLLLCLVEMIVYDTPYCVHCTERDNTITDNRNNSIIETRQFITDNIIN